MERERQHCEGVYRIYWPYRALLLVAPPVGLTLVVLMEVGILRFDDPWPGIQSFVGGIFTGMVLFFQIAGPWACSFRLIVTEKALEAIAWGYRRKLPFDEVTELNVTRPGGGGLLYLARIRTRTARAEVSSYLEDWDKLLPLVVRRVLDRSPNAEVSLPPRFLERFQIRSETARALRSREHNT